MGTMLQKYLQDLKPPRDYFQGLSASELVLPENVILFLRRDRGDLQKRTFASRPHRRFVLIFNLETAGLVNLDGRLIPFRPGQVLLVFPFQFHTYLDLESDRLQWLFVTFETREVEALLAMKDRVWPMVEGTEKTLERMLALYQTKEEPRSVNLLVLGLADWLQRTLKTVPGEGPGVPVRRAPESRASDLLLAINRILENRKGLYPLIKELSKELGLSDSRLRTIFRESFGFGLGEYLRNHQLHKALALMREPNLSLSEVANQSGYSCLATFSRAFRAKMGMSPASYRKGVLGE